MSISSSENILIDKLLVSTKLVELISGPSHQKSLMLWASFSTLLWFGPCLEERRNSYTEYSACKKKNISILFQSLTVKCSPL